MYMKKTDQGEQKRTLYIQTLGTMRLTSRDEIISLHTSITGKACQLFLLLAYAGTKGITRTALLDALYDRKTTDAANALRINASRLRKLLMQSELPEHTYVMVDKNIYYLTEPEGFIAAYSGLVYFHGAFFHVALDKVLDLFAAVAVLYFIII